MQYILLHCFRSRRRDTSCSLSLQMVCLVTIPICLMPLLVRLRHCRSLPGARGALPTPGLGPRFRVPHDSLSLNSVSSKTRSRRLYQSIRHIAPYKRRSNTSQSIVTNSKRGSYLHIELPSRRTKENNKKKYKNPEREKDHLWTENGRRV